MLLCMWFVLLGSLFCYIFFFKQKTAYEMRISDWSSDVCSSDLPLFVQQLGLFEVFAVAPQVPVKNQYTLRGSVKRLGSTLRHVSRPVPLARTVHELGNNGAPRLTPPPRPFPPEFTCRRLDRLYQRGLALCRPPVVSGGPWHP